MRGKFFFKKKKKYKLALLTFFRFYPTDSEYASLNGNTRPGTVVDKGITAV
jgi:hypothetical protein